MTRRLGAYVLPGDTVWLERTLPQWYPLVERIVVPVPADHRSWTGRPLPVARALEVIRRLDTRGIVTEIHGRWTDPSDPRAAEVAQRQAAVDALGLEVEWILCVDNDELMPRPERLSAVLDEADRRGVTAVEWPMRVLYRATRRSVLEVVARDHRPIYEYPGPIAVRPGSRLTDARRSDGPFLRPQVAGDDRSIQVTRAEEPGESRARLLRHEDAIIHRSWARPARDIRRKIDSSGHARDTSLRRYYWMRWWPSPLLRPLMRDFHPLTGSLWPALVRHDRSGVFAD
ncbi:hypothetical protein [Demequina sp. NBRC 110053]|uniref:hypothetical protein n=1 Tax=Demequina sp. NBRC 110053 TaxID=1570342 RepID=UPI0011861094|nr:hypothetical protein [Demequina sp. NBRC 110053]